MSQIYLLGTPQIWLDGRLLTELKSVKAQALLFYLAVSNRVHNRSVLAGLLWGNLPETVARANLSKTIGRMGLTSLFIRDSFLIFKTVKEFRITIAFIIVANVRTVVAIQCQRGALTYLGKCIDCFSGSACKIIVSVCRQVVQNRGTEGLCTSVHPVLYTDQWNNCNRHQHRVWRKSIFLKNSSDFMLNKQLNLQSPGLW